MGDRDAEMDLADVSIPETIKTPSERAEEGTVL